MIKISKEIVIFSFLYRYFKGNCDFLKPFELLVSSMIKGGTL